MPRQTLSLREACKRARVSTGAAYGKYKGELVGTEHHDAESGFDRNARFFLTVVPALKRMRNAGNDKRGRPRKAENGRG